MRKLFLVFLFSVACLWAQQPDSTAVVDTSFNINPASVLFKSILVPGVGQVSQERLWEAAFFYGMSVTYYYQAIQAYSDYKGTSKEKYYNIFRQKISIAVFIHILNIIDAYDSAYRQNVKSWKGTMFSDQPIKSPWGATLRSAIFPGWGQWYNEAYFKSALYFGLVSLVGYQVYKFNQDYQKASSDYDKLLRIPENVRDNDLFNRLANDKKGFKDDRSRYSWYLGLTYLIMLADAHVDAHLFKFDETIEIAMPVVSLNNDAMMVGFSISF